MMDLSPMTHLDLQLFVDWIAPGTVPSGLLPCATVSSLADISCGLFKSNGLLKIESSLQSASRPEQFDSV